MRLERVGKLNFVIQFAYTPKLKMRAYYSDHFRVPLPDGHRFPMDIHFHTLKIAAELCDHDYL